MTTNSWPERVDTVSTNADADVDALYHVLSASRRRFVLRLLGDHSTPMALADVADELAAWERDADLTEVPAADVKSVYMSLYHVHVPKMEDAGVVEYGQQRDAVALAENAESLLDEYEL